jgi:hypothetical protein
MLKTIHDRLVDALVRRGAKLTPYETKRYTALSWPSKGRPLFFFVGKNGALRMGANITDSIPVPPAFKARLLAGTTTFASKGDARSTSAPVMRLDMNDETG